MLLGNGTSGVFLAARVDGGGCYTMYSTVSTSGCSARRLKVS